MIYQKKTINNVPTKRPISNSVPVGNPVGTIISTYKKIQPRNYLYCDGSTFDETIYPALYLYLGTNVLPDYRECAMVGAEKNTTDVFDSTETNPSTGLPGTQNHDVYTVGQFKDDQVQNHSHNVTAVNNSQNKARTLGSGDSGFGCSSAGGDPFVYEQGQDGRKGTVTRGKRKAVYYYIKAVDGVDISDEDSFLNTVKNYVSNTLDFQYAGRIFATNQSISVPKTAKEISMVISNTGSILTSATVNIPVRSILASENDERINAWSSIGNTTGTFTTSGDNIVVTATGISSSYIRVWYR